MNPTIANLLHYGGGAALIALGLLGMSPITIPGVHVDSSTCIAAGLAALGLGGKSSNNAAAIAELQK